MTRFSQAIVVTPGRSFAKGLTSSREGAPDIEKALGQHRKYIEALRHCGLQVHASPADELYPDGTFIEDTAVIAERTAIVTRPGAPSRAGEIESTSRSLKRFDLDMHAIRAPGMVDGGDVCQVDRHFLIGLSSRTNQEGADQLAAILQASGFTSAIIDVRGIPALLHLKSGLTYLGDRRLLLTTQAPGVAETIKESLHYKPACGVASRAQAVSGRTTAASTLPGDYQIVDVPGGEEYAANCLRVNDRILVPSGYPKLACLLQDLGYSLLLLDMSEFRKMDGGLSCLSLRF